MSDDANITGRGAEIMLPPQGNPFKAMDANEPTDLSPVEVESQLNPAFGSLESAMGKTALAGEAEAQDGVGGIEEPTDLTPADIAAMFPSSQDERNAVPGPAETNTKSFGKRAGGVPDDEADADPRPLYEPEPEAVPGARAAWMMAGSLPQGARAQMAIPSADPGRQPKGKDIDINSFNPDAPIGKPKRMGMSKGAGRLGKVEIDAFDPDAPVAASAGEGDASQEAGSIKADIESTEGPEPTFAERPLPDFAVVSTAESTPITSDVTLGAGNAPAPMVGFQPYDPFAPAGIQPTPLTQVEPPLREPDIPIEMGNEPGNAPRPVPPVVSTAAVGLGPDDEVSSGSDEHTSLPTVPALTLPVPEDNAIVDRLITDSKIDELWQRIDLAEKAAVSDESTLPKQRAENLENLKAARNLLLGGRKNYEDALRYVAEVESDLFYAGRVRQWSYSYGTWVLVYNLFWIGLLVALLIFGFSGRLTESMSQMGSFGDVNILAVWITVLSGGLGGVSKSLFALHQHVTKQDFDKQHLMWYYTSPIIGTVLGVFVYMFVQRVILGAGAVAGLEDPDLVNKAGFVFYLLAWVVGFQQNLVLELVERVKKVLLPDSDKEKEKEA
jgi:hypothetical protein